MVFEKEYNKIILIRIINFLSTSYQATTALKIVETAMLFRMLYKLEVIV